MKPARSGSFKGQAFAVVLGAAVLGVAATSHAAVITSINTGSFSNDSVLILPTGGYAVDFGNTTSTTTTGSSAGATTGVKFEGGPAATTAGINSSSTSAAASLNGTTSDVVVTVANGTATTKLGSSGSYLGTGTTPTLATAKAPAVGTADTNFGALVGNGEFYSGGSGLLQIALNNLTVGDAYEMQLFLVDGRSTGGTSAIYQNSDDITNSIAPIASVQIHYADGATIGGFIDAAFTADATSQSFYVQTFAGATPTVGGGGNIQALVLQDQGAGVAAPEPASLGVLALGAVSLMARRRR